MGRSRVWADPLNPFFCRHEGGENVDANGPTPFSRIIYGNRFIYLLVFIFILIAIQLLGEAIGRFGLVLDVLYTAILLSAIYTVIFSLLQLCHHNHPGLR